MIARDTVEATAAVGGASTDQTDESPGSLWATHSQQFSCCGAAMVAVVLRSLQQILVRRRESD
jgi:hypothetical protein